MLGGPLKGPSVPMPMFTLKGVSLVEEGVETGEHLGTVIGERTVYQSLFMA